MKNLFITLKAKNFLMLFICLALIFSHFFCYFTFNSYKEVINSVSQSIFNSFNSGDTDTNDKDNNIFFVSTKGDYKFLGASLPSLKLPSSSEYTLENGIFTFSLKDDFTIKCSGTGIVKKVGYLENGLKYVEIIHSGNITTRYENLKVVGVGANYNLKNIHIIGTCLKENPFVFKILKNEKILQNYIVLEGEIKWQN